MKFPAHVQLHHAFVVAPLAGAWIEITMATQARALSTVALLAGGWIEISRHVGSAICTSVAPLAGGWIEIRRRSYRR